MINVNYKLKQIYPNVFLFTTNDDYDLAMTFCRVQEFYESPFTDIKGSAFDMTYFQRKYSKKFGGGTFTYPHDWVGFNVPGHIIEECYYNHQQPDLNDYDETMKSIHGQIMEELHDWDCEYYLIGATTGDKDTIKHETAHAFYTLHPEYKKTSDKIVKSIKKEIYDSMKYNLKMLGYCNKVVNDEIQAYLVTNPSAILDHSISKIKKQKGDLNKLYDEYARVAQG